jgi:hypothetical protein
MLQASVTPHAISFAFTSSVVVLAGVSHASTYSLFFFRREGGDDFWSYHSG